MDREVGASFNFEGTWKWVASFVTGLKSGGGANISGLESGVGNKLQERTGKWGVVNLSKLTTIKRAI